MGAQDLYGKLVRMRVEDGEINSTREALNLAQEKVNEKSEEESTQLVANRAELGTVEPRLKSIAYKGLWESIQSLRS